ncbi:MAG: TatD family hydrolase [Candidatus Saccharimonadales bacterium]|nr:TatD family hydrolase [Candidatus Saccharimonadales bacterium]
MNLVDTHCHIHSQWYELNPEEVISRSIKAGVNKMVCVGTTVDDSKVAVNFAAKNDSCWAAVGIHPHDSKKELDRFAELDELINKAKTGVIVAIGEIGLDFYYNHSPKKEQLEALHYQIELALKRDLSFIFHIREAFEEFWKVFDQYQGLRGVVHSFSSGPQDLDEVLSRNLYVGLNGIMTFTRQANQLEAARRVPLNRLLLETDAPFLTPVPYRGKVNTPEFLVDTAKFLCELRGETLKDLAKTTTQNAKELFKLMPGEQ